LECKQEPILNFFPEDFGNGQLSDNFALSIGILTTNQVVSNTFTERTFQGGMVTGNISLSTWYHVAYTQNSSLAIIYLNGVQAVTGATQPILRNISRTSNFLGNTNWEALQPSNAEFDEVKIWNRALSAADVAADRSYNRSYIYTL
jgi:hypothetical protein